MEIFDVERFESSAEQVVILVITEEDNDDDNTMSVCLHIHDSLIDVLIAYHIPNLIRFSLEFWTSTYNNRQPLRIYNKVRVFGLKNPDVNRWLDW